ncbi:MAG: class I SAM-dependent methyltransferase [Verrucomicrobiaceae bacterium]|nr:class I SAM-dependent methyltransferase [Verrucomicrobiaceae bacterium]
MSLVPPQPILHEISDEIHVDLAVQSAAINRTALASTTTSGSPASLDVVLPKSTFLKDTADELEGATEFDLFEKGERRLVGRVKQLTNNLLVGEVVAEVQFPPAKWHACDLAIRSGRKVIYRGSANLMNLDTAGTLAIGEWILSESVTQIANPTNDQQGKGQTYHRNVDRLRILDRISAVFRAAVADLASILEECRQITERTELALSQQLDENFSDAQKRALMALSESLFPVLDAVISKFEKVCAELPEELDSVHHLLVRQQLHPYLLTSPFIQHIYAKPMGYAGDFGALDKLLGDPYEGKTLFGRLINAWLVLTSAGEAYRHRIQTLTHTLHQQAALCRAAGRPLRVLSIGCGAAPEAGKFIAEDDLSEGSEFTLVDFNETTLAEARNCTQRALEHSWRQARIQTVNRSVQNLVAEDCRMTRARSRVDPDAVVRPGAYDVVYCTGLYDYFSDRACERLTELLYHSLAPQGSMLVCNFTPANPIQHFMRLVLDWKLVHRTPEELLALAPNEVSVDQCQVTQSPKGVEAYLHIAKPKKPL